MNITMKIKSIWHLDKRQTKMVLVFAATALFWACTFGKLFPENFLIDFLASAGPLFLALAIITKFRPKKKAADKGEVES